MKLLKLRTNVYHPESGSLPFSVYTVGTELQSMRIRMRGFSANHLLLTLSGSGVFRVLGSDDWLTLEPGSVLYIPASLPHVYMPKQDSSPWQVGYVTFIDEAHAMLGPWGFGVETVHRRVRHIQRMRDLLGDIWLYSGPQYDKWRTSELLFTLCMELKKQGEQAEESGPVSRKRASCYRGEVVDRVVRFLDDYLQRDFTLAELSSYVGYSSKQLNRIFQQSLGMTPLQYVRWLRLHTAARLLEEQPELSVAEAAAYVGMEPEYFGRQFKREFGAAPSVFRQQRAMT
ncbi:AraC family transcriptional regulator [Paenibacillus sp. YYML68]|uniref:AraC family transcriptional regulator n=1 Tax=Paenibacillus sp. YYML68 TaxID=2909250 RepID=UPI002493BCB6|nr:AraC family transcriptional regulator [Paenibacillus sp. YYML68]